VKSWNERRFKMKSKFRNRLMLTVGLISIAIGVICMLDKDADKRVCGASIFCGICVILIGKFNKA